MKKVISSVLLLTLLGLSFQSCKKDPKEDEPTGDGKPKIENLAATPSASVKYGDVVTLTGKFTDDTGLSSYTVTISNAQGTLIEVTNMLTGKEFNLNLSQVVPLPKNAQAGNVTVNVTVKNSGNNTVSGDVTLSGVAVPDFEKLYLDAGGIKEMVKEDGVYVLEDLLPANAAGKIYTKADKTGMFWGWANGAVTGLAEGNITFGLAEATTVRVEFDLTTFALNIEEGNPWQPIDEDIYILGNISGHWADGNITVEQAKMKMTGYASGEQKYWTWEPPEGGDNGPEEGMWGNINPGEFRFKIGGEEKYILFDGSNIVEGTTNDEAQSFLISTGGHVIFTLYYDGTQYNKLSLEVGGKSLDYTNEGFVVNGSPLPAVMSFAGGSLTKKEGSFWLYEGVIDLGKDEEFTATGVDLSKATPDMDVFMGGGTTWKMIGTSGEWLIRVDPFIYSVYACKLSGYPDAIYLDSWGWSKFSGDPANNWSKDNRLCLQRVDETSLIYEATFWNQSWGDKDGWGPDMLLYASPITEEDIIISGEHFIGVEMATDTHWYMKATDGGRGNASYQKVRVDLKDGFDLDTGEPVGDKFTITFTDIEL